MKKQNKEKVITSRYLAVKVLEEFISMPNINIAELLININMPEFLDKIESIIDTGFKKASISNEESEETVKVKKPRRKKRRKKNLLPALSKKSKIGNL